MSRRRLVRFCIGAAFAVLGFALWLLEEWLNDGRGMGTAYPARWFTAPMVATILVTFFVSFCAVVDGFIGEARL